MKRLPILLLSLMSLTLFSSVLQATPEAEGDSTAPSIPVEELRLFAEVFDRIKSAYVEPVTDQQLLEDAIRGMLSGLDPHSAYLDAKAFENLQVHTSGQFGGLGIEVGLQDGFIRVIAPIDDTPAQRAGIQAGDLITKIGDESTQGISLNEAVDKMRGRIGTRVTLTLVRDGVEKPFEVTLERASISVTSVRHRLLETGYGMIRISQFQNNTAEQLLRSIETLKGMGELNGIVLDLRNNPGGVLQAAVQVSDAFLSEGLIVYTDGRLPNSELSFSATPETPAADIPLVVLINAGSASASEIVAGALQDHRRAVVMGTDSFGKGSVQTILPVSSGRGVKLTTARYFTPSGRSIQADGIRPDVVVEDARITRIESPAGQIRERDLSGHLQGDDPVRSGRDAEEPLGQRDYQLYEALNLLKALNILQAGRGL
ncbi:MAG: S41 family peptidase [Nitrincola lacisaponensis]|uniref:Carboxyl-terminal protease n=1 Tax=Nitrincola lacisaponensis TaxID=267850 RepID=A0A063Y112_9GAMM|nr:S41 family peptidase [Nitrincola lacisaponensis]KDE38860.1 Carboxyl-terminal protease [Nitrincola lacisaponensis]